MSWPRFCGGGEVGIYSSTEREGQDAKGTTNVYERVQTGSGAAGAEQRQEYHADCSLGIADSTLHQWCKLQAEQGEQAFPGSGHQTAQEEELRCLKRELETVRQERDMLKKVFTCTHGMSDEVSLYRSASPGVPSAKDVPGVGGLGQWLVCLETATGERSPDRR